MTVYVVWHDPDPGYAAARILGVYSTRDAAELRCAEVEDYDSGVIELSLDESADVALRR